MDMECVFQCNMLECNKLLSDSVAWITSCGHLFCCDCGPVVLGFLPLYCPICSQHLRSPFDVLKTELKPPEHFKKMVLLGMTPGACMEAAMHGIRFWENQVKRNAAMNVEPSRPSTQTIEEIENHYQQTILQMNQEIVLLKDECERVKEELEEAHRRPQSRLINTTENVYEVVGNAVHRKNVQYPPSSFVTPRPVMTPRLRRNKQ